MRKLYLVEETEVEFAIDFDSKFGQFLADTVPADQPEPLEVLIAVEQFLLDHYGVTLVQAKKLGYLI